MCGDIEYSVSLLGRGKGSIIYLVRVIISKSSTRSQPHLFQFLDKGCSWGKVLPACGCSLGYFKIIH